MVTKEVLLARIEELRVQHDNFLAQANACAGAMADCQYWIDRMAAEEKAAEEEAAKEDDAAASLPHLVEDDPEECTPQ